MTQTINSPCSKLWTTTTTMDAASANHHACILSTFLPGTHMRSFNDEQGNPWQAALMEASYGNILLIFTRIGADTNRQMLLDAAHIGEAEQMLARADQTGLCRMLSEATPWGS